MPFRRAPLPASASAAAFPLGGIGTGNVSLGARGELRDWEIRNEPSKGTSLPCTFFSIHTRDADGSDVSRVLEADLNPPYEQCSGWRPGTAAGLPRMRTSELHGEYPLAEVRFQDDRVPLEVSLEAFTPLIPIDAADSGVPVAVLRYRLSNRGSRAIDARVAGWMFNPVGWRERPGSSPVATEVDGDPCNEFRSTPGGRSGLMMTSSLPSSSLASGSLALLTDAPATTADPDWSIAPACGAIERVWNRLDAGGDLVRSTDRGRDEATLLADVPERMRSSERLRALRHSAVRHRAGTLAVPVTLAAGEERTVQFLLCWYFPNRPRAWLGPALDNRNAHETVRNFYATRFADAWAVGEYVLDDMARLEGRTREFHELLHRSSVPAEVIDALATSLATARSTTCFRLEDGVFAAWEGSNDRAGSCEGTCTHVWNYAQTLAFVFPDLERSARRVEFLCETDDTGRMNFRGNSIFGAPAWDFPPAVDGQLGTVVRLCREWRHSGDDELLTELWPAASRALQFARREWDRDDDLLLEHEQHTTYDIEFHGANPLSATLFCAALHAAAQMAAYLGHDVQARQYATEADRAAARTDALWNGEYFAQVAGDVGEQRNQFGDGCLTDQVFGQLLADLAGVGDVLPRDRVRAALAAVYRHNFRADLREHRNFGRSYALAGEAGVVLCSWPRGGRPEVPFVYCDEVWSGVEYQLAAHLILEGMVDEGLHVVRAVRARHDGFRRSPWNEIEAGNHYARSLSAWALLIAHTGFRWSAPDGALAFVPPVPAADGRSDCFFSTGTAWGRFVRNGASARVEVRHGTADLRTLTLPAGTGGAAPQLRLNATPLATIWHDETDRRIWTLPPTHLDAGDVLTVTEQETT